MKEKTPISHLLSLLSEPPLRANPPWPQFLFFLLLPDPLSVCTQGWPHTEMSPQYRPYRLILLRWRTSSCRVPDKTNPREARAALQSPRLLPQQRRTDFGPLWRCLCGRPGAEAPLSPGTAVSLTPLFMPSDKSAHLVHSWGSSAQAGAGSQPRPRRCQGPGRAAA